MEEEKIVSIEERIPRLRESRRKKANRTLLLYLTLFFLLIAIIIYLQSPFSNIKHFNVLGNEVIPIEQLKEYSQIKEDANIWRVSTKDVEKNIKEHPLVAAVSVKRKLPQTIEINVKERKIVGYTTKKGSLFPILEDGTVLKDTSLSLPGSAPLLSNFDEEQYLHRLAEELKETPDYILKLISEIHWKPTKKNKYKITLYMNDGYVVQATIRDFSTKIKSYPSIVSQLESDEKAIIHMDVGIYVEMLKK